MKFLLKIIFLIVFLCPFYLFSQEPTATIASVEARFCESGNADLIINFTGTPPFAFAYKIGGTTYWEGLDESTTPIKQTIFDLTYTFTISETSTQEVTLVRVYDNNYQIDNINRLTTGTANVSGSMNIIIDEMPTPSAGTNDNTCGLEYTLKGTVTDPSHTIWWSDMATQGTFEDVNSPTTKFTANTVGPYTLTLNEKNGTCTATSSVDINIKGSPKGVITDNTVNFCSTDATDDYIPVVLNFTGTGDFTYEVKVGDVVYPSVTTANKTETPQYLVSTSKNIILYSVKDESTGCDAFPADLSGLVIAKDLKPTIYAGDNSQSCGKSFTLQATKPAGTTGSWSTPISGVGFNDPSQSNAIATFNDLLLHQDVTFIWEVTEPVLGCTNQDDVTIHYVTPPSMQLTAASDRICDGIATQIPYTLTGNAPWSIEYNDGSINTITHNAISQTGVITEAPSYDGISDLNSTTTYQMTKVTDNFGCETTYNNLTYEVIVDQKPIPNAGSPITVCGKLVELSAEATTFTNAYWMTSQGKFEDLNNPETTFEANNFGVLNLVWHIENVECSEEDDVEVTFLRQAYPVFAGNDTLIYGKDHITLHASELVEGNGSWSTYIGSANIQSPNESISFVNNMKEGDYKFIWTGKIDNPECEDVTDTISVRFKKVFVPNGFSPNGDGNYDNLKILGYSSVNNPKLSVFDKTGKLVFKSDLYDNNWDGKDNSGSDLPSGTYYMVFEGDDILVKQYLIIKR